MGNEMESIEKNKTWVLTDLPEGHKVIDLKWVYKLKWDTKGKIQKYKARLVGRDMFRDMELITRRYSYQSHALIQ